MVDNTITGAASLLRTSLLAEILPYPKQVGAAFHDRWIGLVAPLKGDIGYVGRALYDYVQHATSVIGHNYYKGTGMLVQDPRVDLSGWSFHGIGSKGGNTPGLKPGLPLGCRNTSA
jgi:hypothetical protein